MASAAGFLKPHLTCHNLSRQGDSARCKPRGERLVKHVTLLDSVVLGVTQ